MKTTPIVVPDDLVSDGQVPLPRVGDTIGVSLTFIESEPDDVMSQLYEMRCEPVEKEPRRNTSMSGRSHGNVWYRSLLYGEGWVASWKAPRLIEGAVRMSGTLYAGYGAVANPQASLTGKIQRIQLVNDSLEADDAEGAAGARAWKVDLSRRTVQDVLELPRYNYIEDEPASNKAKHDAAGNWHAATSSAGQKLRSIVVHLALDTL